MLIIHASTELAPIAKAGGLGDVVYGLSKALIQEGHSAQVILPKYSFIKNTELQNLTLISKKYIQSPFAQGSEVSFWKATYDNISLILVEPHAPSDLFQKESIYGHNNDITRFLLFSFLAVEYLTTHTLPPFILHLHDWPTAFIAYLYSRPLPYKPKIILTIHNILHQGRCDAHYFQQLSLQDPSAFIDPKYPHLINLLKSGIIYADHVTTVSPTYAQEITTSSGGHYLDPLLYSLRRKLTGILNGIDLTYWDPSQDPHIAVKYPSKFQLEQTLDAKAKNKKYFQKHFHLKESSAPLFVCISRLDEQKGPHLIAHAIHKILELGGQCAILGKIVDPMLNDLFHELKNIYSNNRNFCFHNIFDEDQAHKLYAAADFILIPSLFEPCGLTQMIGMRYFTIPIARKTGGLADTVHDINDPSCPESKKVGIVFSDMDTKELEEALKKAFLLYHNKNHLNQILKNLSIQDFSWKTSAKKYLEIYKA